MNQETISKQNELTIFEKEIQENFSEIEVRTIKKLGEGWVSIAVLVNNEWVFRFPKKQDGAADLKKEISIMPHLAKQITLAIPQFEYLGKQKNGLPFVGYKILPGEILGEKAVPALLDDEKEVIARQIAEFIDELSSFPVKQAKKLGVPERNFYKDYLETFEDVKLKIFPLVDEKVRQYITLRFETYLGNQNNFQYTPTLIHADLSPGHYLIDTKKRKLTGIIDFGDIEIGDPDYEYSRILEDCGYDFTRRVMTLRGQNIAKERFEKIAIFVTVSHIGVILAGIKRGNQAWINNGIEAVHREMKNNAL